MNKDGFEARLLDLWMRTRIPLTRVNVQYATKAPRKKVDRWLDELCRDDVLEVDVTDDGTTIWTVKGAERPRTGAASFAELEKLERLGRHVETASTALTLASRAAGGPPAVRAGGEKKSLVASGALSFFLGPLGWLYAAPLGEAAGPIAIFLALAMILPHAIFWPLLTVLLPVSAFFGVAYAFRYNQRGERTRLLPKK
jgi:hypothetical protein